MVRPIEGKPRLARYRRGLLGNDRRDRRRTGAVALQEAHPGLIVGLGGVQRQQGVAQTALGTALGIALGIALFVIYALLALKRPAFYLSQGKGEAPHNISAFRAPRQKPVPQVFGVTL